MENCLIILVDSLRYDAMESFSGPGLLRELGVREWLDTPSMNRLLKLGTRIPNLHAPYPATPPSTASLLTGHYPREHHLYGFRRPLHPEVPTLADHFRKAGFHTILQNGHVLFGENGIRERFDEHLRGPVPRIGKRIRQVNRDGTPVFAYVHSFDVHRPYLMSKYPSSPRYHHKAVKVANHLASTFDDPETFRIEDAHRTVTDESFSLQSDSNQTVYQYLLDVHEQYASEKADQYDMPKLLARLYAMGVSQFDRNHLGPVVDFLTDSPAGRDTVFFLTGDHGETLRVESDHQTFYHGGDPREDLIRVPGILIDGSKTDRDVLPWKLTSLVDVAPTILNRFDLDYSEETLSGRDWRKPEPESRCVYSEVCKTVQEPDKEFPLNSLLTWNSIIRSDGLKYYRKGLDVSESDYRRPLNEFVRRVVQKIEFVDANDAFLQSYIESLSNTDSLEIRRTFVQHLKQEAPTWQPRLHRWDEDLYESRNLLENNEDRWDKVSRWMDHRLQGRFVDPQDLNTPLPNGGNRNDEELKQGLKGLGYL